MMETFKEIEYKKLKGDPEYKDVGVVAVEGAVIIEANTVPFFDELWVLTLDKKTAFDRITLRDPHLSA